MKINRLAVIIIVCLAALFQNSLTHAQPYQIGHVTLALVDSSRNSRQIPVEVYYPALMAGEEVPVAPGQFPVLSFGHGFVMTVDAYTNFSDVLVPQGYIFVLANTETGFSPGHLNFALDLSYIIHSMTQASTDPGSLFFGSVAPGSAVMGHSMGGGASLLAAGSDTNITVVVNFAAANTNPSAISASANISIPALLFAGSEDCVAPPSQHQEIMYDSLASSCKTLVSITGGGHCYFANDNFLCTFGENSCSPNLTITREQQQEVTFSFLGSWLDYFLKDNQSSWEIFTDSLISSQRITYRQECDVTRISEKEACQSDLKVFPIPIKDYMTVDGYVSLRFIEIYDITGREVFSSAFNNDLPAVFSIGFLDPGFYQIIFTGVKGEVITRKVCKF